MFYASLKEAWDAKPVKHTKVVLTDPEIVKYFNSFEEDPNIVAMKLIQKPDHVKVEQPKKIKKARNDDIVALLMFLFLILFY
jgi:hypothetical protein